MAQTNGPFSPREQLLITETLLQAGVSAAGADVSAAAATTLGTTTITAISASVATSTAAALPAAITAPNAADQSASYVEADVDTIATLANDLKARQAENLTLLTELKADYNALQLEVVDLRARQAQNKTAIDNITTTTGTLVTLANALRTAWNAFAT